MVQSGVVGQFIVLCASVVGLWVGARLFVDAAVRLAKQLGLSDLTIGLTIVALGTSLPELSVSIGAAVDGIGDIAVANLLGSNIFNIGFILGGLALLGAIPISRSLLRRDGSALIGSTALGGAILYDLTVTRIEGLLLVSLLGVYMASLVRPRQAEASASPTEALSGIAAPLTEVVEFRGRDIVFCILSIAVVIFSGDLLLSAATGLARGVGLSEWVIGGTIVAAGTSTPEFAVSLIAFQRGRIGVSVGNVIGSNVINITGIMGVAAVASPLAVDVTALLTLGWLGGLTVLIIGALWTDQVFSRLEGAVFTSIEVARWIVRLFG